MNKVLLIILLSLLLYLSLLFSDSENENEKKRKYNSRVTEIEQGTFTPLVFTTTGGMGGNA